MKPRQKPDTCRGCPAERYGVGFVPPLLPQRGAPTVAFIGQGPGEMEARYSEPFWPQAPAGEKLMEWIYAGHGQRTQLLLSNIVWCWLPSHYDKGFPRGNREPTWDEVHFCYQRHLGPLLQRLGFLDDDASGSGGSSGERWVFTVGTPATRHLLGEEKVEAYLGTANQRRLPSVEPF